MSIINPVCPTCLTRTCTHPEAMEMLHEQIRAANVDMFASLPPTTGQTDPTPDTVSALESAADTPAGPTHTGATHQPDAAGATGERREGLEPRVEAAGGQTAGAPTHNGRLTGDGAGAEAGASPDTSGSIPEAPTTSVPQHVLIPSTEVRTWRKPRSDKGTKRGPRPKWTAPTAPTVMNVDHATPEEVDAFLEVIVPAEEVEVLVPLDLRLLIEGRSDAFDCACGMRVEADEAHYCTKKNTPTVTHLFTGEEVDALVSEGRIVIDGPRSSPEERLPCKQEVAGSTPARSSPPASALREAARLAAHVPDRRCYLGSSDLPMLVGTSPFGGAMDVYLRKAGLAAVDESEQPWLEIGTEIEGGIARVAGRRLGLGIEKARFQGHPPEPWAGETIDYLTIRPGDEDCDRRGILEIKNTSRFARNYWPVDAEEPPQSIIAQTTWQAGIEIARGMVLDGIHVARLIEGAELRLYAVKYDPELFALLLAAGKKFWFESVVPRVPPPLDGSDAAGRYLKARYPRNGGNLLPATEEARALAMQYRDAMAIGKSAEDEAARAKYALCAMIGESDGVDGCATWRATKSAGCDWKALAESKGATAEEITKFTRPGHRTFRLTLKEEKS